MLIFNIMNERQRKLLEKVERLGRISIEEEAAQCAVSTMTIRRDIQLFEERGLVIRSQGGAIPRTKTPGGLLVGGQSTDAQKKIAKKTIELIPDGCTIMLSTGGTTLEVARQLAISGKQLSVVTNSLLVAAALFQTSVQVILTGGTLRSNSLDLSGPVAEKNIDEYYIDILVTGCDGAIAGEGFFTKDLSLAEMERKAVTKSKKVVVVTDSQKFQKPSFVKFASSCDISIVVTDGGLSMEDAAILRAANIDVVICR